MQTKERKVYSFKGFRGLDKENKAIKVAPFRASDGENFIIDSGTLKTRPAFKHYDKLSVPQYLINKYIIDWYKYKDVYIYVTDNDFIIQHNNKFYSARHNTNTPEFVTSHFSYGTFENLQPLFQEEKDCLFIFCLNDIYVFSVHTDEYGETCFAIYNLKYKPANRFEKESTFSKWYEDLPTPYEPVLFIGNNRLDDVNLLSNVSKYRLFAETPEQQQEGYVSYLLPTHYDKQKHGKVFHEVSFYKGRLDNLDFFPVYLGIEGENFQSLDDYGEVLDIEPVRVQETFRPEKDFEFNGIVDENGEIENVKLVSALVNLDRKTFFNFKVKNLDVRVFDYLISYIRENQHTLDNNVVFPFVVTVEYVALLKDARLGFILDQTVSKMDFNVYVELRKEVTDFLIEDLRSYVSEASLNGNLVLPEEFGNEAEYKILTVTGETHPTLVQFEDYAKSLIHRRMSEYTNEDKVLVKGMFTEERIERGSNFVQLNQINYWYDFVPIDLEAPYPVPQENIFSIDFPNNNMDEIREHTRSLIQNKLDNNELPRDEYRCAVTVTCETGDPKFFAVFFTYQYEYVKEYTVYRLYAYSAKIKKTTTLLKDSLSTFKFNEEQHAFELKVRDYFFDYNDEPPIDVRVVFENNPDYDLIAKSKFGITFGSENRLFLAGNPDYPNIDRYNVSNDLLGDNVKSQSYELTYFPSKNYRVVGGQGKINGYIVATDTILYVTKEEHSGDGRLFMRERILDENGVVGYKEYRTSIDKSPLNNRCLVRFYNDILMLSKDGLYSIEISSNVLTNERLIKLRSGFINTDLKNTIKNYSKDDIFILENNEYLYIFIGNNIYVADNRYVDVNPNSVIDNVSYEIVKWKTPHVFKTGHFVENELVLLSNDGKYWYTLKENENTDDIASFYTNAVSIQDISSSYHKGKNAFLLSPQMEFIYNYPEQIKLKMNNCYKVFARQGEDYELQTNKIIITNFLPFVPLKDGDILFFKDNENNFHGFVVEINNDVINIPSDISGNKNVLYTLTDELYISLIFDYLLDGEYYKFLRLSPIKRQNVEIVEKQQDETDIEYQQRLDDYLIKNEDYYFTSLEMQDCRVIRELPIEMYWASNITDLGNSLMEKTTYRVNLYVTRRDGDNVVTFGYKTMRGELEAQNVVIANPFDFNEVDLGAFALSTFSESGMSFPMKKNNFLYIQFLIKGKGKIEINGLDVIYKNNRGLKTFG